MTQTPIANALTLAWHPSPISTAAGREVREVRSDGEQTVREILLASDIDPHSTIVIVLGDELLTVEEWDTRHPRPGEIINVQVVVNGGGGKSNPLQFVAMIALMVVANAYGATLGAEMGLSTAAGTAGAASTAAIVGQAVIMAGGSMIINGLFKPNMSTSWASGIGGAGSPTYSISGGSNRARPYEPLPLLLGSHRFFPDYAAKPYAELQGEDQYLYQAFNFGFGSLAITDYRIGNTPLSSYLNTTIYDSASYGGNIPFPINVDSTSGGEIEVGSGWVTRTGSDDTTRISVDIEGTAIFSSSSKGPRNIVVTVLVEYAPTGTGSWVSIPASQIWHYKTSKLIRTSFAATVAKGKYDVRVQMINAQRSDTGDTIPKDSEKGGYNYQWATLRSYQTDEAAYLSQRRIGLVIQASGQLNGTVQQLSAQVSASSPYWNGSAWVTQVHDNPAYWYLYFVRGGRDASGRLLFGLGFADSQIDIEGIKAWGAFCAAEGMSCNLVVDQIQAAADVLQAIARCGFASPTFASGKLGVVWDARNASPVAMFGMSNIIAGSFQVEYMSDSLADEIVVSYIDGNDEYQQKQVRVKTPGTTIPTRSTPVDLAGCTNILMAGKFANALAAQQYYRRRNVTFETDFEGFVCTRGDVIVLSHDLTQWAYSGRIVSVAGAEVTLDKEVPRSGSVEYLSIRQPNGTVTTYSVTAASGSSDTLLLSAGAPTLQAGELPMDHIYSFSPLATPGKRLKITGTVPVSESRIRITATDDYPEYYAAWNGVFNPVSAGTLLKSGKPKIDAIHFTEELIRAGAGFASQLDITLKTSGMFDAARLTLTVSGRTIAATIFHGEHFSIVVPAEGVVTARMVPLTAFGQTGAGVTATYTILGMKIPPNDVLGFNAQTSADRIVLSWFDNPDVDLSHYEVREGATWIGGSVVAAGVVGTLIKLLPAAAATYTYHIKAFDTTGNESTNSAVAVLTIAAPSAPVGAAASFSADLVKLAWSVPAQGVTQLPIASYLIRHGASFGAGVDVGSTTSLSFSLPARWGGSRTFWIAGVDIFGNVGSASSAEAVVTAPPKPTNFVQQVVDNNVLFTWGEVAGTLPTASYELRKGATWAGGSSYGTKSGGFTTVFETSSGQYTYWLAAIDVAGNVGTPENVVATVNQPPDYVLKASIQSVFAGAKVNSYEENGSLLMLVNTSQTFAQHFTTNSWTTPQQQVNAGYPLYIQPGVASASYEEFIDYGAVLAANKITVSLATVALAGSPTFTIDIKVSLDNVTYTTYAGVSSVYATNFRYIKVVINAAGTGGAVAAVTSLTIRLDSKLKTITGTVSCVSGDAGGTIVYLTDNRTAGGVKEFIDVDAIQVTPSGTTALIAIYDFVDAGNPLSMKVLLFTTAGARASGLCSYTVRGF